MQTLKFKTNINCGGCIASIGPKLDQAQGILKWNVDITNPQKTLTVETENLTEDDILFIVSKAGYKAEKMG